MKFDWELFKGDLLCVVVGLWFVSIVAAVWAAMVLGIIVNLNWLWLLAYPIVCGIAGLIYRWTY